MTRRRNTKSHGLEGGAFVVLSDIFINTAFLLVIMLVAVTLTSSSALKQVQINDAQHAFETKVSQTFPQEWNHSLKPYDNGNYQRLTFSDSLFFESGLWTIKPDAQPLLNHFAPLLQAQLRSGKVIKIVVEGHTDQQAMSPALAARVTDSWGLSALRSMAVVRYLQDRNVPGSGLTAVGRGEFSPLDTGRAQSDFARNRRIEIILVYAAGEDHSAEGR